MIRISIVTISYNQARYLEETICSVVEQDYPHVEYIVVDPGSTDGSRDIIDRYRDRIDKVIFEPDNGPADGLNKGFAQATGDIFGFLNSDDVLLSGALSQVANAFSRSSLVDVISGHGIVIDANGKEMRRTYSDHFYRIMAAYGACILVQQSTFFRSQMFNRVGGFNIDNRSNWDGELFVDMSLHQARFKVILLLHLRGPEVIGRGWIGRLIVKRFLMRPDVSLYLRTEELAQAWLVSFSGQIRYLPSLEIPEPGDDSAGTDAECAAPIQPSSKVRFGIIGQIRLGKGIDWLEPFSKKGLLTFNDFC